MASFSHSTMLDLHFLLKSKTPLSEESILKHIHGSGMASQACWKGKSLISCSGVRNLFWWEYSGTTEASGAAIRSLFIGSLVESEYITKRTVYFVFAIIDEKEIRFSKCCCVAANRTFSYCKHVSAHLHTLLIIQQGLFSSPPKWAMRSQRTL